MEWTNGWHCEWILVISLSFADSISASNVMEAKKDGFYYEYQGI
jgi:hypothetical protein